MMVIPFNTYSTVKAVIYFITQFHKKLAVRTELIFLSWLSAPSSYVVLWVARVDNKGIGISQLKD